MYKRVCAHMLACVYEPARVCLRAHLYLIYTYISVSVCIRVCVCVYTSVSDKFTFNADTNF
jgi:hypothetical protein